MPVTTTSSPGLATASLGFMLLERCSLEDLASGRVDRRGHGDSLTSAGAHGHRILDRGRRPGADPGHLGDVLDLGLAQPLERAEVLEQGLATDLAEAGYVVEDALDHRLGASGPVVGDREPVRLVADPLEQVEALRRPGQDDRV